MKRRLIIPLGGVEEKLKPYMKAIRQQGLNPEGLIPYGMMAATGGTDYQSMAAYLVKDMMDANPGIMDDPHNYHRVLHTCLDFVGEAARHISPQIERTCGVPCDHRVEFEQYLGDDDAVISIVY